jgi:outer membrane protein OmpA-like peptidoglycan-associated protein
LDSNTSYVIQATAEGFEDYSETLSQGENNAQIKLIPIPKKTFVLQNMHFATAQTTILPSSRKALDLLYELLNENPDLYIRIVGHTDDVGSEEDNDVLSKGRANSIYQEMVKRGINPKRIQVSGKGELAPLVPNTSEANRQKNRRVEIDIISGDEDVNIERLTQ